MDNYYSGPPKFHYQTNQHNLQLDKAINLTRYETKKLINLETQSNHLLNLVSENSQYTQNGPVTQNLKKEAASRVNPEMKDQASQYDQEQEIRHEKAQEQ